MSIKLAPGDYAQVLEKISDPLKNDATSKGQGKGVLFDKIVVS